MDVHSLIEPFISVSGQIINSLTMKESKISISKGIVYLIIIPWSGNYCSNNLNNIYINNITT